MAWKTAVASVSVRLDKCHPAHEPVSEPVTAVAKGRNRRASPSAGEGTLSVPSRVGWRVRFVKIGGIVVLAMDNHNSQRLTKAWFFLKQVLKHGLWFQRVVRAARMDVEVADFNKN